MSGAALARDPVPTHALLASADMSRMGFLVVDKPSGAPSRAAVDRVARLVRPAKAGHAGTLDPLASGVLLVAVGGATRLIPYAQRLQKAYRAQFVLGRRSVTDDLEAEVELLVDPPRPTRDEIESMLGEFRGVVLQRPPAYSAVKVGGRRAYDRARRGEDFELEARPVRVDRLTVAAYEYPVLDLELECGAGTYVRSLGRDLATRLGTAAVMSWLVRERIGPFTRAQALPWDALSPAALDRGLASPLEVLAGMPRVQIDDGQRGELAHGRSIVLAAPPDAAEAAALLPHGGLAAIVVPAGEGRWRPSHCFVSGG